MAAERIFAKESTKFTYVHLYLPQERETSIALPSVSITSTPYQEENTQNGTVNPPCKNVDAWRTWINEKHNGYIHAPANIIIATIMTAAQKPKEETKTQFLEELLETLRTAPIVTATTINYSCNTTEKSLISHGLVFWPWTAQIQSNTRHLQSHVFQKEHQGAIELTATIYAQNMPQLDGSLRQKPHTQELETSMALTMQYPNLLATAIKKAFGANAVIKTRKKEERKSNPLAVVCLRYEAERKQFIIDADCNRETEGIGIGLRLSY
ncbi:hypothetical protein HY486_02355 [Candidatus Woesearchaeota archaeon]|nr:hypothetical protein [Candidatus Woesearchaeota archaeon]